MTTNSISSSILQSLYAGATPTAVPAAASFAAPTAVSNPAPTAKAVDNSSDEAFQSALAKLQQTDPALAQKLKTLQDPADPTLVSPTAVQPTSASATAAPEKPSGTSTPAKSYAHHGHKPHLDPVGGSNATPTAVTPPTATAVQNPLSSLNFLGSRFSQGQSFASFLQSQAFGFADSTFASAA